LFADSELFNKPNPALAVKEKKPGIVCKKQTSKSLNFPFQNPTFELTNAYI